MADSAIFKLNEDIINNALDVAKTQVDEASDAAQNAMLQASGWFSFDQPYTPWKDLAKETSVFGAIDRINAAVNPWVNVSVPEPSIQQNLKYINQNYAGWGGGVATEPDTGSSLTLVDKTQFPTWAGVTAVEPDTAAEADSPIKYFYQAYPAWAPTAVEPAVFFPSTAQQTDPFYKYETERERLINWLTGLFAHFFVSYYPLANDAFDDAVAWLKNTIVNGGTGIPNTIESQIWQRHRDNIQAEFATQLATTFTNFSAKGFSLPPGALAARIEDLNNKTTLKLVEASRDLAIKRTEIELENIKFAVELATKLRMQALQAASDYIKAMAMAPDISAKLVDFANDAQAKLISATADFYRARLQRDDLLLKSWAGLMEQKTKDGSINADLQAKMLSASSDLYKARLSGDDMTLKAWSTFVETGIKADIANIDAKTKAKSTDADLYKARVAKDELDQRTWIAALEQTGKDAAANLHAEVQSYSANADLYKARIADKEMSLKAWLADLEARLKVDIANIDAQTKSLTTGADLLRARVANQALSLESWKTVLAQKGTDAKTSASAWAAGIDAKVRAAIGAADAYGRTAQAALQSLTNIISISTQAFED